MKLSRLTAALVGAVLALTACGGSPAPSTGSGKTIKIGLAISETGTSATSATGAKNAMGFAVKQINDKGGIDGAKIEFVTRDIGSPAATAGAGGQHLAQGNEGAGAGAWPYATPVF